MAARSSNGHMNAASKPGVSDGALGSSDDSLNGDVSSQVQGCRLEANGTDATCVHPHMHTHSPTTPNRDLINLANSVLKNLQQRTPTFQLFPLKCKVYHPFKLRHRWTFSLPCLSPLGYQ